MRRDENRRFLIRIGVAAACVGNVMTLSFALYGGVFTGIEAQYAHLFRWTSMLFGMVALAWPGSLFFRGAWAALRTKTAHLDLPIAIGLAAGGIAGTVNAILGRGEIYFDSLTMLVLLLLVGRWLQRRQQCWANDSLELLFSLTPTSARRLENGAVVEVPIEAVQPGDLVEVRAGDSIPADGSVLEGESSVNRALLTGESQPTAVGPGSAVNAGTVNLSTRLVVQVEAVGEATRVGRLMQLVEQHSRNRPPIVQFADRIAGRFVRIVLAVAAITFLSLGLVQSRQGDRQLGGAAHRHLPLRAGAGHAAGRDHRLGPRRPAAHPRQGRRGARSPQPARRDLAGQDRHAHRGADLAGLLERRRGRAAVGCGAGTAFGPSDRPGPGWTAEGAEQTDGEIPVCDVEQTIGGGISGTVAGRRLVVGSPKFVRQQRLRDSGRDRSVPSGRQSPQPPRRCWWPSMAAPWPWPGWAIRCGRTRPTRSTACASSVGRSAFSPAIIPRWSRPSGGSWGSMPADAMGGASPEAKLAAVREAAASGPMVMVGDGVNDAAALSAASVGIAVHGGAEASLAAAHVYLDRPGLAPILELMHAARSTLGAIRRCFVASICYNSLAGTLAVTGVISPLTAAILMPISSFTVFALAYAVRTFGDGKR